MSKKIRVALLFGGRSAEHEISRISALAILRNLDPKKYEVIPIAIERNGRWLLQDAKRLGKSAKEALPVYTNAPEVLLSPKEGSQSLVPVGSRAKSNYAFDVVIPMLHGPMGEDGTIQGLLELLGVPYVGCGVLSSAVGMDKDVAYRLAHESGITIAAYKVVRRWQWESGGPRWRENLKQEIGERMNWPVFVKPTRLGSSVGISKVKSAEAFMAACQEALRYDDKIIIQKAVDAREIECAVLGDSEEVFVAAPGEVIPKHEFYSYEAKYLDPDGAVLKIPADLTPKQAEQVKNLAQRSFLAFDCEGMARVDFLLDRNSSIFYFSEINTIPGFTSISMYPKMMEASGIPYPKLLDRLIALALKRKARDKKKALTYKPKHDP
ncbi:MAG: D-alanine--D-alanine ligase [Elusimicrobia bacterium]|nr:D-alanine--D-alanine ligase [Elusimicrobiota bacterium]